MLETDSSGLWLGRGLGGRSACEDNRIAELVGIGVGVCKALKLKGLRGKQTERTSESTTDPN